MKKIALLLANGTEEVEALSVLDCLYRGGVEVDLIGINEVNHIISSHNVKIEVNKILSSLSKDNYSDYEAIVIPGGIPGATNLRDNDKVIEFLQYMNDNNKLCAAMCAGPIVLAKAGIISNKKVTSYPNFNEPLINANGIYTDDIVCVDKNIITARGPAISIYFGLEILEYICGKEKREQIAEQMLIPLLEKSIKNE